MNLMDIIVAVLLILFIANGYQRGFIRQFADFLGLALSVVVSFAFYNSVSVIIAAEFPTFPIFLNKTLALSVLWISSQIVFYVLFNLLYRLIPKEIRQSKINKGLGAIPGLAWGLLFIMIAMSVAMIAFSFSPSTKNYQKLLSESFTGKLVTEQTGKLDNYFTKIFGGSLNDTLTFKTVPAYGGETQDLGFKTTNVTIDAAAEEKMLKLLNEERVKRGLVPLVMDEKLRELARDHSRDMFARGYFAHVNPDGEDPFARMDRYNIKYLIAGENLALAPTTEMAHEGLMNSPGHRANILTPEYRKIGIGCINGGKYGLMFSQEFTN